MKDDFPENGIEAIRYFADKEKCHDFLVSMRWPDGIECPRCQSKEIGKLSKPRLLWNCKGCKKQFTAKVGTIFEDSPLGLDQWLPAVWLIVNAKNGISSCEIARYLGVTQKTAWHMGHRIRTAIHQGSFTMRGDVEVDETFIGGKARFMHKGKRKEKGRGPVSMQPVMGLLERTTPGKPSRVILKHVSGTKRPELQGHVRNYVLKGSNVHTDALRSYNGLEDEYVHGVVDHAIEYARGHVHTNGMENFWSLLKRSIKGTYVCVEPFHLFRYLDEQAYRFNERKEDDPGRFLGACRQLSGKKLTYRKLIGAPERQVSLPLNEPLK